jgi:16S rRNA (guanine527-N7)-methyltransferase
LKADRQSPEHIAEAFDVSRESLQQLRLYVDLLLHWQKRINLIGPSTTEDIWTRHIVDSLQLLPLIPPGIRQLVDLGSGAGLPGLVLAIASSLPAVLVESNDKKSAFLREAIRQTGVQASVATCRIEDVEPMSGSTLLTARALAPLSKLFELSQQLFQPDAVALFHNGQDVDKELAEARKSWTFTARKHKSMTDPRGIILEIADVNRSEP